MTNYRQDQTMDQHKWLIVSVVYQSVLIKKLAINAKVKTQFISREKLSRSKRRRAN
jgi:hypothetical protein